MSIEANPVNSVVFNLGWTVESPGKLFKNDLCLSITSRDSNWTDPRGIDTHSVSKAS